MTLWTISFLVVTLVEGLIITGFERYIPLRISEALHFLRRHAF
jgi:hypothetical protein